MPSCCAANTARFLIATRCGSVGARTILPSGPIICPKYLLNVRVIHTSTVTSWIPFMFITNGPTLGPKAVKPGRTSVAFPPTLDLPMPPYLDRKFVISATVWLPCNHSTAPFSPKPPLDLGCNIAFSMSNCFFLLADSKPPIHRPPVAGLVPGRTPVFS